MLFNVPFMSLMSSLAQEESRSISENCTWGWRKRCADGKVSVPFGRFLGYDRGEDGNLVVNEEQAKIVRKIYGYFLQGRSPYQIAKLLTEQGIPTPGGKNVWGKAVVQSILTNGWTLPIVCRPDLTIIDGFHRWTVSGREPLLTKLGGKVPVVIVDHHGNRSEDMYGTITHNRARGTHLLEPMKAIVRTLLDEGKDVKEISRQLGMRPEEIFRLSDFSKEEFINMMAQGTTYSRAQILSRV